MGCRVLFPCILFTHWKSISAAASISIHDKVSPGGNCKTINHKQVLVFFLTLYVLQCQVGIISPLCFIQSKQKTIIKSIFSCALYTVHLYIPLDIYFDRFFKHRQLRNRKLGQKVLLAYVNGINIIAYEMYVEKEWTWGEASNKKIETDFF